jgi:hypothetical protein
MKPLATHLDNKQDGAHQKKKLTITQKDNANL